MASKVLLADDSDVMRAAIARLLKGEPDIELVAEASTFAEMIQLTATLNPDILLLDLYMPDEHEWPPEFVKAQVAQHRPCIIAISVSIDEEAHELAASFGARVLLDKAKLFLELIPAIKHHCSDTAKTVSPVQTKFGNALGRQLDRGIKPVSHNIRGV
jgi:two-component system, NarL family, nitrate/nitrite response regulator NarL